MISQDRTENTSFAQCISHFVLFILLNSTSFLFNIVLFNFKTFNMDITRTSKCKRKSVINNKLLKFARCDTNEA